MNDDRLIHMEPAGIELIEESSDIKENRRGKCKKGTENPDTFECGYGNDAIVSNDISSVKRYVTSSIKNTKISNYVNISTDTSMSDDVGADLTSRDGKVTITFNEKVFDSNFFNNDLQRIIDNGYQSLTVANRYFRRDHARYIKCLSDHETGHVKMTLYTLLQEAKTDEFGKPRRKEDIENFVRQQIRYAEVDPEASGLNYWAAGNGDPTWRTIMHDATKSGFRISEYSLETYPEGYAEMYAANKNGIEIPSKIKEFISNVDKTLEDYQ